MVTSTDPKNKRTLISLLITQLVQCAFETLHQIEGVQALSIPTSNSFEVRVDILHMWGIVPQVKGVYEGLNGHSIHLG